MTEGTGAPCEGTGVLYSTENCGSCVVGFQAACAARFETGAGCHVGLEACYADQGACYVDQEACYADQEAYYVDQAAYYADQEAFYADLVACCADQEACHADWDDQGTCHADLVVIQDDQVAFHVDQDDRVACHAFAAQEAYHVAPGACYVDLMAFLDPLVLFLDLILAFPPLAF